MKLEVSNFKTSLKLLAVICQL